MIRKTLPATDTKLLLCHIYHFMFRYLLQVSINDGFSTMICSHCRNQIDAWHKFREQCTQCNDVLQQCIVRNVGLNVNSDKQTCTGQLVGAGDRDLGTGRTEEPCVTNGSLLHQAEDGPVEKEPAFHIMASHTDENGKEDCTGTGDDMVYVIGKRDALDSSLVSHHDFDVESAKSKMDDIESGDDKSINNNGNTVGRFEKLKNPKDHSTVKGISDYKTYGCSKCGKTFSYTSNFSFHICNLTPEKRFVCNLCGKDYSTAGAVKTHLHIHRGKHKCPTCGKSFPSKFQVEVHMRIHTGEKPYVCEYCGKRFAYDKGLALHTSIHTGVKPYKCDECNYSTTSRSYIKNHKSVHSTEKPFVCEICGHGYTLLPSLMNHQLNHNDQKTYTCEVCNKAFNTSRKLASHKIIHSGVRPYHCEDCGKQFTRKEGLKEHKVIHTGEKKFVCLVCKKQFAWRKILRTHKCIGASDSNK